jgi:hypothetical protein
VEPEDIKQETYYENRTIHETVRHGKKKVKVPKIIKIENHRDFLDTKEIREKLSRLPEFKYLGRDEYDKKVNGFNVPKNIIDKEKLEYVKE